MQRDQDIQDIQCQQPRRDVLGAPRCGEHVVRRHASRATAALVYVIDGCLVDQIEVAGTTTRLRQREREHEKITLALEYMIGLTYRRDPTTVLKSTLQSADIHTIHPIPWQLGQ